MKKNLIKILKLQELFLEVLGGTTEEHSGENTDEEEDLDNESVDSFITLILPFLRQEV